MIGDVPYWWYHGQPYYPPCYPQPIYQSSPMPAAPTTPACWNEIACTMHKCRELGCACLRDRSTAALDQSKGE